MAGKRRLPRCEGRVRAGMKSVRFCPCPRCAVQRAKVVARIGLDSDHPAAVLTRAFAENV